ncbi:MAG: DUF4442 domain-containing protein [Bacteroidota bacterium]
MKVLNMSINRKFPFNKPHGFKVLEIGDDHITIYLPFKKVNQNHIKGMHATALATLAEFTTGLSMLRKLDPKKFRIILKTLRMEYFYQAKSGVTATYSLDDDWLNSMVIKPLKDNDAATVTLEVDIHDAKSNHICTGFIEWQVKDWKKVRTKL